MIYLVLSILTSSVIFMIFKFYPKFKIDTFQAIVFNYITAASLGYFLFSSFIPETFIVAENKWIYAVGFIGVIFISLFYLMGVSSQKNGVATTSVTVKMSLILPVIGAIFIYQEKFTLLKFIGIILALAGVFLMSYTKSKDTEKKSDVTLLIILFIGSGFLDILLNYTLRELLGGFHEGLFAALGFGIAGCIGLTVLIIQVLRKKTSLYFRNLIGGIALGIPNFFSIYFLLLALKESGWEDSVTFAVNNTGIVLVCSIVGFLFLKEVFNLKKLFGLILAVGAISILAIAL